MKSKSTIIFIIYFIISSIPEIVVCQDFFYNGYIITQNKDTIKGKIKDLGLNKNSFLCTFIPNDFDVISDFKPGEIYSYYVRNKYYVSKHIIQENYNIHLFAEYLVDGILDLYNVVIDNETFYLFEDVDSTQYLIKVQRNTVSTQEDLKRDHILHGKKIGTLKMIMQDYSPIFKQIDNIYLENRKSVVRLVGDYHNGICTNEKCFDYTKKEIKPDLYIGLTSGLYYPILSFSGDNYFKHLTEAEIENKLSFLYGLDLYLSVPSISERFSIDFIFEKSKVSYVFNYSKDFNAVTNLELNFHSYSILFNYLLIQKKINFSPSFGISNIRIFNHEETNYIKEVGYHRNPIKFYNGFAALNSGINFDMPLYTKWDLYFRAKVGYKINITPLNKYIYLNEKYQNLIFGLTLFKKISPNDK